MGIAHNQFMDKYTDSRGVEYNVETKKRFTDGTTSKTLTRISPRPVDIKRAARAAKKASR